MLGRDKGPGVFVEVLGAFLAHNFGCNSMNLCPPRETKASVLRSLLRIDFCNCHKVHLCEIFLFMQN